MPKRLFIIIAVAFLVSTLLTTGFILRYDHYVSPAIMALSGMIAGGKWVIQILIGFFVLGQKRWNYIAQLATTCLVGSLVLLPYAIIGGSSAFFFGSLVAAIIIMAIDIYRRLKQIQLPVRWFYLWLGLLAIAVTLQLTVVFKIIPVG